MGSKEATYPLRVAVRMTGLSAERLRAWESRHDVVRPIRSADGSRRYRAADLERLRLLREVVDAGHRIGDVAALDDRALRARLARPFARRSASERASESASESALQEASARGEASESAEASDPFEPVWGPLVRLEAATVGSLFDAEHARVGTLAFARGFVLPFLAEVGQRWEAGELSVAAEHLASSLLATILGRAVHASRPADPGAVIVFATPSGERHALGLFVAALTAAEAGADPVFLGADVPEEDLVASVSRSRAAVLALGLVALPDAAAEAAIRRLRARLPARVAIWIGGPGAPRCAPIPGVERIANLDQLAALVASTELARDRQAGGPS